MRYLYHVLLASLGFITAIVSAQSLESSLQIGGIKNDAITNVERDIAGNIYVVGSFANTVDFNPNGTPYQLESPNTVRQDVFVAKYNKDKTLNWIVQLGGNNEDRGAQLVLDDSLNVYVTGYIGGTIDFDPSSGVHESGGRFILKLNNDGEFKAVNNMPTITSPSLGVGWEDMFKDDANNFYVYLRGDLYKFDSNLNLLWSQSVGGLPKLYNQTEIHTVYASPNPLEGNDLHLYKYDASNGSLISSMLIGHTEGELVGWAAERDNNGDLLVFGKYWGSLTLSSGGNTAEFENYQLNPAGLVYLQRTFVCKLDGLGNLLWAKGFDDKAPDYRIVKTDSIGNIYTFGAIHYYAVFNPDNPTVINADLYSNNCYIAKYDSEFNLLNVSQFLGVFSYMNEVKFYGDDMVICGDFNLQMDLNLSPGTQLMETNGIDDGFVLEYSDYQSLFIDEAVETHFGVLTNPLTGMTQVNINSTSISEHIISVYDLNGRVLNRFNTENNTINLDLSAYPNGTYFIQVSNDEWSATEKVVK